MSLVDLLRTTPDQVRGKTVQQLISFAGAGRLMEGSECSRDLRDFLATVSSASLDAYVDQCLTPFQDSGMALQDLINEVGRRLGADVTRGRYRGSTHHNGFDGLWKFPSGHAIIVEVKTTDAFRINLATIADYRSQLVRVGAVQANASSILIVVGRQDTGDLEAQIRGSRFAWDVRVISVHALLRLLSTKEEVDDPQTVQRIHSVLIPREFTRLDEIAEMLFWAKEDIRGEEAEVAAAAADDDDPVPSRARAPKFVPVAFHGECIARVEEVLHATLVKQSRSSYASPEGTTRAICMVSREHDPTTRPNYWFAFHPHQQAYLDSAENGYLVLGLGSAERLALVPFRDFQPWLSGTWTTERDDRFYWHIAVYRQGEQLILRRRKGEASVDLTPYLVPATDPV